MMTANTYTPFSIYSLLYLLLKNFVRVIVYDTIVSVLLFSLPQFTWNAPSLLCKPFGVKVVCLKNFQRMAINLCSKTSIDLHIIWQGFKFHCKLICFAKSLFYFKTTFWIKTAHTHTHTWITTDTYTSAEGHCGFSYRFTKNPLLTSFKIFFFYFFAKLRYSFPGLLGECHKFRGRARFVLLKYYLFLLPVSGMDIFFRKFENKTNDIHYVWFFFRLWILGGSKSIILGVKNCSIAFCRRGGQIE